MLVHIVTELLVKQLHMRVEANLIEDVCHLKELAQIIIKIYIQMMLERTRTA